MASDGVGETDSDSNPGSQNLSSSGEHLDEPPAERSAARSRASEAEIRAEEARPPKPTERLNVDTVEQQHDIFESGRAFASWLTICAVGYLVLCLSLTAHHLFSSGFKPGDRIDRDLVASHSTLVVDEDATARERQKARDSVVPVFKKNPDADRESLKSLNDKFARVAELEKAGLVPWPINPESLPANTSLFLLSTRKRSTISSPPRRQSLCTMMRYWTCCAQS